MPKLKTKRAAAKRFKVTKSGKILRGKANRRHILEWETAGKKRNRRGFVVIHKTDEYRVKAMLGDN
ncbi:MAG: 50S ribosomal protein L35 [bacterium]